MALYSSSSSSFTPCLSLPSTFSLPLSLDCYCQQNASILGLLLLLLLVPSQLCRSSLHLRRKCKHKNAAKFLVEVFWKTEEKTLCKKNQKKISAQQLRSSEGKKRENFCLRSTFFSFEETEEKRVRLVGTSMFFFANLEDLAKFGYNLNM
jgi:hypothetical protein